MLIIHNAKIYTQEATLPWATALVIDGARILAVGSDDQILSSFVSFQKLDANGRTLLPGFTDAHIHLEDYALSRQIIDCESLTQKECLQRVAERVRLSQPGEWIKGHGWNQNRWPEGYGTASLLDQVSPKNPVYLTHKSLHAAWVNSSALHLAQIDRHTPDPPAGRINHDDYGEPDGILLESAMQLVEKAIPEASLDQVVQGLRSIQPTLARFGLTSVHDFDRAHCFSALQVLRASNELKLRVIKSLPFENLTEAITLGLRTGFGDELLQVGAVKLFADGALGPQTAAMLEPYEAEPQNSGILMLPAEELYEIGKKAVSHGLSLAVHAIGDRANRQVLDAYAQIRKYEQAQSTQQASPLHHRIEHVQVLHPDDLHRFSQLNIIASMQPIHATSDMLMAERYWGKRSAYAYAWRSLLSNNTRLIFGSDAPVESPNPFLGIHAALTRRVFDDPPSSPGWYPQQCLTITEAIHAYTTGPTFAANLHSCLGKLIPGYLADLVILNDDPYSCPVDELPRLHPLATMVGGEWVFSELE